MRPDHLAAVRRTWELAKSDAAAVGLLFYEKLFEHDPSLRALFPADVAAQATKLMQTVAVAVASLDRLETLTPALENLGRRHVAYGVRDDHYDTVGHALLETLADAFGDAFTPEVRAAWAETYAAVAGVMRRAGGEEAAALRDLAAQVSAAALRGELPAIAA
jgi:hemoglobin-like flavoprotein